MLVFTFYLFICFYLDYTRGFYLKSTYIYLYRETDKRTFKRLYYRACDIHLNLLLQTIFHLLVHFYSDFI